LVIALSMSVDAFAAAAGKGAALHRPRMSEAVRTGLIFGAAAAIAPAIGWALGWTASAWIKQIDHWVAFTLLLLIGGRMCWHGFHKDGDAPAIAQHSLALLALTALATSIDALAVGVTLAFIDVDVMIVAAAIGGATFVMAVAGSIAGRWIGPLFGRAAEVIGGLCLVAIGFKVLVEHLTA
jgi:putative Mn2+ efflux pump MntP